MNKFEQRCREVSEETNIEVDFYYKEGRGSDCFEDDGTLHVSKRGTRACFDVGRDQTLDGKEQNDRTRAIMEALGLKDKINDRVLIEESDEDDYCEYCGR